MQPQKAGTLSSANTASQMGASIQGGITGPLGPPPPGLSAQRASLDHLLPIGVVEGVYTPIMYEKAQEIERIRRQVRALRKDRYIWAREFKNQKL